MHTFYSLDSMFDWDISYGKSEVKYNKVLEKEWNNLELHFLISNFAIQKQFSQRKSYLLNAGCIIIQPCNANE